MAAKKKHRTKSLAQKETPRVDENWNIWILAAILLLTTLIYSNSLGNGFIYFDDPEIVIDNYFIRQITWDNLIHYFTTPLQFTYIPLAWISYAIDYQIAQLDPYVYHLHSLILHLANVILVYLLFQLMTGKSNISLFIAGMLAIHPVNVDTIDWVTTRIYLMSAFYGLASLLFYTYYLKRNLQVRYLVLACVAFALSGLSKNTAVFLPFVLLLWDYYFDRKWTARVFLEKIPFFVISLILGILTLYFRQDVVPPVQYNLLDRVILFLYAVTDYFYRLIFPVQLSMSYAYPAKDGMFLPYHLYLAPFILFFVAWGLYKLGVSKKVLIIGLSFFVLNVVLSQSVLLIDNFMANRYVYLSYVGLFFILADLNQQILNASDGWKSRIKVPWRIALVVFVAGFSFLTYARNFVWKDTVSLFDDVVAKQPNIPWVYSNRGVAKYRNGDYDGALKDFDHSLELDPNFALSWYYRGVIHHALGDYDTALADLDQTVALVPDFSNAYNDRGKLRKDLQDYQGAMDDFSAAIGVDPYFVEAYLNRGFLKSDQGDYQGAVEDYTIVIQYDPAQTLAYYNRGVAEIELGDYQAALDDFSRVTELDPYFAEAFYRRAIARLNLNDSSGYCQDLEMARSLGYEPAAQEIDLNCT